jgi:hypothetical protein
VYFGIAPSILICLVWSPGPLSHGGQGRRRQRMRGKQSGLSHVRLSALEFFDIAWAFHDSRAAFGSGVDATGRAS